MIFVESVDPGAVMLTDSAKSMKGHRAMLGCEDVGALLRVVSEHRSEMESRDGDFELRRAKPDEPYDFTGRICDEAFGLSVSSAHVLRCALERACLDISRTRT